MAEKPQIWFYEGSPAASLVRPLKRHYRFRTYPRPGQTANQEAPRKNENGVPIVWPADTARDGLNLPKGLQGKTADVRVIGVVQEKGRNGAVAGSRLQMTRSRRAGVFAILPRRAAPALVEKTIAAAFENIDLTRRERAAREELAETKFSMEELNRIGVALSSERDRDALLRLILQKAREITHADAGSLYLVEEAERNERQLRFKLTQNDSRQFPFEEFVLSITEDSMAGYVALQGEPLNLTDAYELPLGLPFHFNLRYDEESGYRTRSLLTLPMKNARGEVLGVLQLINCKRHPEARLDGAEAVEREVQPFPERAVRLATSLASQAAVAYENSKLNDEIAMLFEGFVKASVKAIEQRDPTTSGHSFRVSALTQGLAETVDAIPTGPYARTHFSREQMKEIRYAALLHDFGKVGVREEVLVKARKLYPEQLKVVRQRFDYIRKELEARAAEQKLQALLERRREEALERIGGLEEEHKRALEELDEYFQFILRANEPTVLSEGKFDRLVQIARKTFRDPRGAEHPYLEPGEVHMLSVPKGTLDDEERLQIESHVVHTFNFLMQIPWTKELSEIPSIARAHHEKLDGTGYPYRLRGDQIPLPAKMMTICDIFDALSASDRPYKRAVPVDRAMQILEESVRYHQLDEELFRLFREAKIYERTALRPE